MSFTSWLQSLRSTLTPGRQRQHGRRGSLRATTHRLSVQALEDRLTPSFSPATSFPVGTAAGMVATADFNNDGNLDLATASGGYNVRVLLGDGQGGFGAASLFAAGWDTKALAVGDFDTNNAQHHGTPNERRAAWLRGFERGRPSDCTLQ